ncbi:von Willebrand factor A domain-containing protein 1 isoform X2 [Salarias fasciatus]|uniref:von Willebrand factor A domain-containing protein 1 isoform X2 n=1 Tax=Salarias fasciatus TaxID=181472 RepID=UPI001176EEB8|nr:von Willebrand factor A domain-containing protein 1 isoform X2 [Salarias fasciatus]
MEHFLPSQRRRLGSKLSLRAFSAANDQTKRKLIPSCCSSHKSLSGCRGDVLVLLDSSGSVANYEYSHLLLFAAELVHPFPLGRGRVRVGLLQVGTRPHLEFGLDVHDNQESLQRAMQHVSQLQGDTNTKAALRLAQDLLIDRQRVPKVLLWLTDGVQPGDVDQPMSELKEQGVSVLAVSTVHANYKVLQRAVTPPLDSHLYSVDIDNINIITHDLREAITKIICAEQLQVVHLTSHSAVLQWRPVVDAGSGYYEFWYKPARTAHPAARRTLSGDSRRVELDKLQPETAYTAWLRPESNRGLFSTLSVNFTTLPDVLSPAEVTVSASGPRQVRVSWGPLQPERVQKYVVEYGAIPSGAVGTVTLPNRQASTVLSGLEPDAQYLVTVSALHVDGKERAMSVRACTLEALPSLADLQLTPVEQQEVETEAEEVQVTWRASRDEGLRGFWVTWEREASHSASSNPSTSSVYLPPNARSTRLARLAPSSRVCVSPVYSSGRGDGLCCTANSLKEVSRWG